MDQRQVGKKRRTECMVPAGRCGEITEPEAAVEKRRIRTGFGAEHIVAEITAQEKSVAGRKRIIQFEIRVVEKIGQYILSVVSELENFIDVRAPRGNAEGRFIFNDRPFDGNMRRKQTDSARSVK